jgi:hypothetical protein
MAPRTGIAGVIRSRYLHARRLHALQKDEQLLLLPEPLASTNHMNWLYTAQLNIKVKTTKQMVEITHLLRSMRSTWTKAPLVRASYLVFRFSVELLLYFKQRLGLDMFDTCSSMSTNVCYEKWRGT